jgi:hypothetical protein
MPAYQKQRNFRLISITSLEKFKEEVGDKRERWRKTLKKDLNAILLLFLVNMIQTCKISIVMIISALVPFQFTRMPFIPGFNAPSA